MHAVCVGGLWDHQPAPRRSGRPGILQKHSQGFGGHCATGCSAVTCSSEGACSTREAWSSPQHIWSSTSQHESLWFLWGIDCYKSAQICLMIARAHIAPPFPKGMGRASGKTKKSAGGFRAISATWQRRLLTPMRLTTAGCKPLPLMFAPTGASAAGSLPGEKVSANTRALWAWGWVFCSMEHSIFAPSLLSKVIPF